MEKCRLLLFDLDGTLLRSDKTISQRTLHALNRCRENGLLIGVATSRSEPNSLAYLKELAPDVLITSGGALVKVAGQCVALAAFSPEETSAMIAAARAVCGGDCQITIDTTQANYWNYKIDPSTRDRGWGESIYTDYANFHACAIKMCVEIFHQSQAEELCRRLPGCDCARFSDGYWYKFTRKGVTKESAICTAAAAAGFGPENIIAFGDDYADMGMLALCGLGAAMGNAIDPVKEKADVVIGSNDEDGIAAFLEGSGYQPGTCQHSCR